MAIQQKNSDTSDSLPNLTPGEIAVNNADDVLWVRSEGRRTPIHLDPVRKRAAPYNGQDGAPLSYKSNAQVWDPALAPIAVVDDAIQVDMPPAANVYAVPGAQVTSLGADRAIGVNSVQVEPFQVRSDQITLTALVFAIRTAAPGAVRVGVFDADDVLLIDELVSSPVQGANVVTVSTALPRGAYKIMLWSASAITLGQAQVVQPEQGWRVSGATLNFVRSYEGTADQSGGLVPLAAAARLSTTPGMDKTVLMRWTVP